MTENDAAVGLINYRNNNGEAEQTREANGTADWAYPVYTKFVIYRKTQSGKTSDNRTIRDSGSGWAEDRTNLPEGVAVDEWLDLWLKSEEKANKLGVEIDLIEYEAETDCPCPKGWSESNKPSVPDNLQKVADGDPGKNNGAPINRPPWW